MLDTAVELRTPLFAAPSAQARPPLARRAADKKITASVGKQIAHSLCQVPVRPESSLDHLSVRMVRAVRSCSSGIGLDGQNHLCAGSLESQGESAGTGVQVDCLDVRAHVFRPRFSDTAIA
jgi:hypothetical protein